METNNILQLLKEASSDLKSDEMLVLNDGYETSSNNSDSISNQDSINNFKQTFAFKITNAKHIGHFKPSPNPIYIESNLSSILEKKSYFEAKDGKIKYNKVYSPTSLTLKQIRDIIIKLLIAQYDVFNGFSPYQSFFTCLYLYEEFYPVGLKKNNQDPKYLKITLLKTGIKLILLTFFKTQCLANNIYNPNDIFSNEWSSFDFIKEENNFDHEFLLSKKILKSLIEYENKKVEYQQTPNRKIPQAKDQAIFEDMYKKINKEITELLELKNDKKLSNGLNNPLYTDIAKETLDIILYEQQIAELYIFDKNNNSKRINIKLPDLKNDYDKDTPGFCSVLNYPNTGIKLNSDIESYNDMRNKYSKMIEDILESDNYASEFQKVSKIDELTDIFIEWNSTHQDSITIVRFYFFRKFFPLYTGNNWELNVVRGKGSGSSVQPFKQFVSELFDRTKNLPVNHLDRMVKLFGKFFTYCLRLLIFRPYKLQKSLLKTVIIQWVRNIWQIYKFDKAKKDTEVFSKKMKTIFYDILYSDFKYYICYSYLTNILEMGNSKDMIFLYSFLFFNLVLEPIYSTNKDMIDLFVYNDIIKTGNYNGEKIIDICINRLSFDLLLYHYIHIKSTNKNNKPKANIIELIGSFRDHFFIIQKNIKKYYTLNEGKSDEFNIDDIFTLYKNYIEAFYDNRYKKPEDFGSNIKKSINNILQKMPSIKINFNIKQKALDSFIKMIDESKNESIINQYLSAPLEYTFRFQSAAYPYLIIEKI